MPRGQAQCCFYESMLRALRTTTARSRQMSSAASRLSARMAEVRSTPFLSLIVGDALALRSRLLALQCNCTSVLFPAFLSIRRCSPFARAGASSLAAGCWHRCSFDPAYSRRVARQTPAAAATAIAKKE